MKLQLLLFVFAAVATGVRAAPLNKLSPSIGKRSGDKQPPTQPTNAIIAAINPSVDSTITSVSTVDTTVGGIGKGSGTMLGAVTDPFAAAQQLSGNQQFMSTQSQVGDISKQLDATLGGGGGQKQA